MDAPQRTGLFGGTFNPVHQGHLKVAEQALQRCGLDQLYLIPCRVPPHKAPAYLAPAADRMAMIRLALPDDRRYRLSDVEVRRRGPSYTIDTVSHFRRQIVPGADLYLVMGLDAFLDIHTWKQCFQLLTLVQPVVVTRRVSADAMPHTDALRMDHYIRSQLSPQYRWEEDRQRWRRSGAGDIHLLPIAPVEISSSHIRRLIKSGTPAGHLVPQAVWAYIERKELYR